MAILVETAPDRKERANGSHVTLRDQHCERCGHAFYAAAMPILGLSLMVSESNKVPRWPTSGVQTRTSFN